MLGSTDRISRFRSVGEALSHCDEETATFCPPPPLTENMDPALLDNVTGTLFPRRDNNDTSAPVPTTTDGTTLTEWNEELRVTEEELLKAAQRMASRDVAPGPDGIPCRVWTESIDILAPRLRHLFS